MCTLPPPLACVWTAPTTQQRVTSLLTAGRRGATRPWIRARMPAWREKFHALVSCHCSAAWSPDKPRAGRAVSVLHSLPPLSRSLSTSRSLYRASASACEGNWDADLMLSLNLRIRNAYRRQVTQNVTTHLSSAWSIDWQLLDSELSALPKGSSIWQTESHRGVVGHRACSDVGGNI